MLARSRGRAAVICAVALAGTTLAACGNKAGDDAQAGAYPTGRLSIMAPADPGGGWDQTARALQDTIRRDGLAEGVEVYNVPGAGGTIGLSQLASKRAGDPNQLMVTGLVMVGAIEQNRSPVDLTEVTPIASLTTEPEAIVVPAGSKYETLEQLVEEWKADPSQVSFAGGSAGGADHLLVGQLAKAAGIRGSDVKYVAYSGGGEAKAAILSGSVQAGVSGVSEFADQVEAGTMRVLAVSSDESVDVGGTKPPAIKEAGFDVELTNWRGIVAPPNISDAQRRQMVSFVEKVHASATWKASLERFGWGDFFKAGDAFESFVGTEIARVKDIADDLGLAAG